MKSFAVSHILAAMFDDCIIKTLSFDAESREEQDGGKYSFVGQTTAELQAVFKLHVAGKEAKTKDFKLAEKGSFPCKLR